MRMQGPRISAGPTASCSARRKTLAPCLAPQGLLRPHLYAVEGELAPLPYALFISAGNDGQGAVREIERIARATLHLVAEPPIARGQPTEDALGAAGSWA